MDSANASNGRIETVGVILYRRDRLINCAMCG
jgi:hypothetical protein